jgi:hypothetical protein
VIRLYDKGLTSGALAFTGLSLVFPALAGFALVAAGLAVLRLLPRRVA